MPKDKTESHERIVNAAKNEFMEYGFKDASMRRIAANAHMTASGLYKHFLSKEDMFSALVEPAYNALMGLYEDALYRTKRYISNHDYGELNLSLDESVQIMTCIYDHFDEFKLIICRSEGTRYENFLHEVAEMGEKNTLEFMEFLKAKGKKLSNYREKEFHLLTSTYVDAVFQTVKHNFTNEEALHYAATLDEFFSVSWKIYFGY